MANTNKSRYNENVRSSSLCQFEQHSLSVRRRELLAKEVSRICGSRLPLELTLLSTLIKLLALTRMAIVFILLFAPILRRGSFKNRRSIYL